MTRTHVRIAVKVHNRTCMEFAGFKHEAFAWFEELEANNNRAWFAEHRATYEHAVRDPLDELLELFADEIGGRVKLFRQHRDVRFSRDKSPYKTRTYGLLYEVPGMQTGLFAAISAEGLYTATGYYRMSRDQLERFRRAVDDDGTGPSLAREVVRARSKGLTVEGDGLRTAPRGYPKDHPRIELLRMTSVIAGRGWPTTGGISRRTALSGVTKAWRDARPLVEWLDEHVGSAEVVG